MTVYKGCIIGFGKLGLLHLSQFSAFKEVKINFICEQNNFIKKNLNSFFNNIEIVNDYKKIPTNEIDFVVVTTPTSQHYEIIKYFLKKKISVFTEKPMVSTYKHALELRNLSLKNKILLFTGYMYEFYDTFQKCYELLIEKKILGDIFFVKSEMYVSQYLKKKKLIAWRFNKKLSGGGVVITQTSHVIYFLCRLFGKSNKINSSLKNIYSQKQIEDYAHILIDFENDVKASIDASWSVINYRTPFLKLYFEGSNGNLALTEDKIEFFLKSKIDSFEPGNNKIQIPEIKKGVDFDVAGSHYSLQADHFLDLLKKNKLDILNLDTTLETHKIIDKVYSNEK